MSKENTELEPKIIYVVLTYSGFVPGDMSQDSIRDALYSQFEAASDTGFRLSVQDYHDRDEADPLFNLDAVLSGEEVRLSIG